MTGATEVMVFKDISQTAIFYSESDSGPREVSLAKILERKHVVALALYNNSKFKTVNNSVFNKNTYCL